jgi:hypothetical protein
MSSDDSTNIEKPFVNFSQPILQMDNQVAESFTINVQGVNVLFKHKDQNLLPISISEIPEQMLMKISTKLTFFHLTFSNKQFQGLKSTDTYTVFVLGKNILFDGSLFAFNELNMTGLDFGEGVYYGQVMNEVPHGFGVLKMKGCKFVGEFFDGSPVNKGFFIGQYRLSSGLLYQGETFNQSLNGYGKVTFPNQDTYEGYLFDNHLHGNGIYVFSEGREDEQRRWYQGDFKKSRKDGEGTYHWSENCYFKGTWKDDFPEGRGIFFKEDGSCVEGVWKEGQLISIISKKKIVKV